MKRWLAAAGVVTTAGLASAQPPFVSTPTQQKPPGYVVIRIKLSDGSGGGVAGAAPGGFGGMPSGLGGLGGQGGPGGGPAGVGGGRPGGPGGGGGIGLGGLGGLGGGQGSPDGGGGGVGFGGLGGIGGFGGQGQGAGGPTPATERSVAVLVPYDRLLRQPIYKGKAVSDAKNPSLPTLVGPNGTSTVLYHDGATVQWKMDDGPTLEHLLVQEHKKWAAGLDRKLSLRFVGDALRWNLTGLAEKYANELAEQVKNAADVKAVPAEVVNFVKAYTELKAKWNQPLMTDPAVAAVWKSRLGGGAAVADDAPHYTILHYGDDVLSPEARERKARLLEENFKAFHLWHAMKAGKALPLPDKKLIVVVAKQGADLGDLRVRFDGLPVVADSFYSQQHNVVVLSPERNDEVGKSFFVAANSKYSKEGFDRNELLRGNHPPLKGTLTPTDIAIASTYALVEKVLKDELDAAAITREATRQLFAVSGVLPRHVLLPQWIENGVGSLLQHPRGGEVVELANKKLGLALGFHTGHGSPNHHLLREFQTSYPAKGEGTDYKPDEVLRNTLTDKYFDAAKAGTDLDGPATPAVAPRPGGAGGVPGFGLPMGLPGGAGGGPGGGRGGRSGDNDAQGPRGGQGGPGFPGGGPGGFPGGPGGLGGMQPPGGGFGGQGGNDGNLGIFDPNAGRPPLSKERLEDKARATAWAVTYYLTQYQIGKLHAFYAELDKLPRDMRIDKDTILKTFCTTFNLMTADGTAIDTAAFTNFAKDWMKKVRDLQPSWREVALSDLGGATPPGNQPGGLPGGLPGGGPGGTGSPDGRP